MSKLTIFAPHSGRPFLVYRTQAGEGLDGVLEVRRGGEEMVPLQTISDGGTRMFLDNLDGWPGPQFRDARPL